MFFSCPQPVALQDVITVSLSMMSLEFNGQLEAPRICNGLKGRFHGFLEPYKPSLLVAFSFLHMIDR